MRSLRSTWGKRIITVSLILSILPLVALPYVSLSEEEPADHYAERIRKQLGGETSALVEQAIDTARAADVHDLTQFLKAFVGAYSRVSDAEQSLAFSDTALFALLHSRYLQLVGKSITPRLVLKSLTVRSSISTERAPSSLFTLFKNRPAVRPVALERFMGLGSGLRFIHHLSVSLNPRAP
jgi:hypothetical protein